MKANNNINFAHHFSIFLLWSLFSTMTFQQTLPPSSCSSPCGNGEICKIQNNFATCAPLCGDGILVGDQVCDDGDTEDANGCTNSCQVNDYWACVRKLNSYNKNVSQCYFNPILGCKKYVVSNNIIKCQKCVLGQQLSADGSKCMLQMPGCLTLDQTTSNYSTPFCTECESGYNLTANKCIFLTLGVLMLDPVRSTFKTEICYNCTSAYTLSTIKDRCLPKIFGCTLLDQIASSQLKSYCATCGINYKISQSKQKCMIIIKNCTTYNQTSSNSTKSYCLACDPGYYLTWLKDKCIINIGQCQIYNQIKSNSTRSSCYSCVSQQLQANQTNNYILKIQGCQIYDEGLSSGYKSICLQCIANYQLNGNKDKCMVKIAYCSLYDQVISAYSASICSQCADTHVLTNSKDKCMIKFTSCQIYDEVLSNQMTSACTQCVSTHLLTSIKDKCIIKLVQCDIYDQMLSSSTQSYCDSCLGTYVVSGNKQKCMANFIQCSKYDQILSSYTKSVCTQCATTHILTGVKDKCIVKITGCTNYDQINSNDTVSICAVCDTRLTVSADKTKCVFKIAGCMTYDMGVSNTIVSYCTKCQGLLLLTTDKTKCVRNVTNCQIVDQVNSNSTFGYCKTCATGYTITALKDKCLGNCLLRDPSNSSICLLCNSNYFLSPDKLGCIASSQFGCIAFDANNTCTQAQSGYTVQNSTIKIVSNNKGCQKYTAFSNNCTRCIQGYTASATAPVTCTPTFAFDFEINADFGRWVILNISKPGPAGWQKPGGTTGSWVTQVNFKNYGAYLIKPNVTKVTIGGNMYGMTYTVVNNVTGTGSTVLGGFQYLGYVSSNYTRYCMTGLGCTCQTGYMTASHFLSTNHTQCMPQIQYQVDIFTPLGTVRVYNILYYPTYTYSTTYTTRLSKWRALKLQQMKLIKQYLDTYSRFDICVTFNIGSLYGSLNNYMFNNTIDSACASRVFIIQVKTNQIASCKTYNTVSPVTCSACDPGYTLSADKLRCDWPTGKKCWIVDPLTSACLSLSKY